MARMIEHTELEAKQIAEIQAELAKLDICDLCGEYCEIQTDRQISVCPRCQSRMDD